MANEGVEPYPYRTPEFNKYIQKVTAERTEKVLADLLELGRAAHWVLEGRGSRQLCFEVYTNTPEVFWRATITVRGAINSEVPDSTHQDKIADSQATTLSVQGSGTSQVEAWYCARRELLGLVGAREL